MLLSLGGDPSTASDEPPSGWPRLWGATGSGTTRAALPLSASARIRELWRQQIGSGYSGISVESGRGFTADSDGAFDQAVAFDAGTGRILWRTRLGPTYKGHDGSADGPSSTPTLDGGRAFLVSPRGLLVALGTESGQVLWQHDLPAEYGAKAPGWGFGTSPLVVGSLLVVQVGGESHNLAAFDKDTGKLVWKANHSTASDYSSPILGRLAGRRQVVVSAKDRLFAVEPESGVLLWGVPSDAEPEAYRPPAILSDDRILLQLDAETRLYKVADEGGRLSATLLWRSTRLRTSFSPTVFKDGYLYGFNDQFAVCADAADGSILWRARIGWGSLILVDGTLVVLGSKTGRLFVAPATPNRFEGRLETSVFADGEYAPTTPAFADGRIFLRKLKEVVALEIR